MLFYKQTVRTDVKNEAVDPVLGKKVSTVVYLMNQNLTKRQVIDDLKKTDESKQELVRKAQMNEYIYSIMK